MRRLSSVWILTLFLSILPSTGCLFRTRTVEQQYSKAPLQASTQQELVDALNRQADKVLSLQATVDIDASSGGIKKGKVTDYKEIRGYVLARKPAMLRMIGLMPIVRNKAFDMVSDGKDFKLWIPPKNRFVVGRNEVQSPNATQPLENIRPQIIYDALLIRRVNPDEEIAVLESGYEMLYDPKGRRVVQDDYELVIIRKGEKGWFLSRKVVFSRVDLEPHRQYIFDERGKLMTDARYADYKDYEGTMFPSKIEIYRPDEEYDITLNMLKLEINKPLQDDQFVLQQPVGAEVVNIDHPSSSAAARQPGGSDR